MHLNVYLYDRVYGGPEEGGWYYDDYTPVSSRPVYGRVERQLFVAIMKYERWNAGRRPVSSVLSEGEYVVHLEPHPARAYPSEIPFYE